MTLPLQIRNESSSRGEELLLPLLNSTNPADFEAIVDRFKKPVISLAYRMTGDYGASLEIGHETFSRAWQYRKSYQADRPLAAWLFKITTNLAHEFNGQRMREARLEPMDRERELPDLRNQVEKVEDGLYLQSLLERLNEPQRTAVTLRFLEDLTYDEIAYIMETSLEQVRNHLFRGRKRLLELAEEGA